MMENHVEYGPKTKTQALSELMQERAEYYAVINKGGYDRDASLLMDALESFGMTMNDLSDAELNYLGDIEASLEGQLVDAEDDEAQEQDIDGGFITSFQPDEPMFWKELHDHMGFKPALDPDPNGPIRRALASDAFVLATLETDNTILVRDADGTVRETTRDADGTFEERGEI